MGDMELVWVGDGSGRDGGMDGGGLGGVGMREAWGWMREGCMREDVWMREGREG